MQVNDEVALIPMRFIGPIKINSESGSGEFKVPMATFEIPLWPSCERGAKVSRLTKGIDVIIIKDQITRSIILQAPTAIIAYTIAKDLSLYQMEFEQIVIRSSRFAKLQGISTQIIGNLIYLRISISTQDAAGHNMVTIIAEEIINFLLSKYVELPLKYVSISGNYCTDKKVSAVNSILGRGKYLVAEIIVPRSVVTAVLKTTPEEIVNLHIKKNLLGSILAGSILSANAHFANMLFAIYLATGQDVANIIEGSQGIVHAELIEKDLYFSVTLPNIIVGTVGNGKNKPFVQENFRRIGFGSLDAKKLAVIIAAAVLCGEMSLLAAQTNPSELMRAHINLERNSLNTKF